ncbi:hypothetical protein LOTGIDRAFT_155660 [Lottia gigantea]|uniref:Uncharacterized protein n=1 Tax=Lottia gigantea TaxID=225164 RepID=V3ZEW6_LOTGI|nr:hypothetical protein LOTGIDRAFT_155660 [Lottia gigantea]ESO82647.1 hypothetical protein LOTGIDRAFT_155660 [Lottia gigantea]
MSGPDSSRCYEHTVSFRSPVSQRSQSPQPYPNQYFNDHAQYHYSNPGRTLTRVENKRAKLMLNLGKYRVCLDKGDAIALASPVTNVSTVYNNTATKPNHNSPNTSYISMSTQTAPVSQLNKVVDQVSCDLDLTAQSTLNVNPQLAPRPPPPPQPKSSTSKPISPLKPILRRSSRIPKPVVRFDPSAC